MICRIKTPWLVDKQQLLQRDWAKLSQAKCVFLIGLECPCRGFELKASGKALQSLGMLRDEYLVCRTKGLEAAG